MNYAQHVLTHLRKDLRLEWRTKDSINGMLFFALLVVVVLAMAFDPASYPTMTRQISGGLLWVALLFAAMTALNAVLGARDQQQRPRCSPAVGRAGLSPVHWQGARELPVRDGSRDCAGADLHRLLQPAPAGRDLEAALYFAAGHLGFSRERNVLRGAQPALAQSRDAAAAGIAAHLHAGAAGDDSGNHGDPNRRV